MFGKKKSAQLIKCDQPDYLVHRYSSENSGRIATNSKIVVNESEIAVFVYAHAGESLFDFVEGPLAADIDASTNPTLFSKILSVFGKKDEIEAEVYFINLSGIIQLKFGVPYFDVFDPRFQDFYVPMAVRGSFIVSISDAKSFLKLNRLQHFDLERLKQQLKDVATRKIKSVVSNVPQQYNIPVIQLEKRVDEVSEACQEALILEFSQFGIKLKRLDISAIAPDKDSDGYRELRQLTAGQSSQIIEAETAAQVKKIGAQQEIEIENQRTALQIQRDETQRAQRLSTETQYLAAHRANLAAEVDINASIHSKSHNIHLSNPSLATLGQAVDAAVNQNIKNQMVDGASPVGTGAYGRSTPPPMPESEKEVAYFVVANGQQIGPLNIRAVIEMIESREVSNSDLIWSDGMATWQKIEDNVDIQKISSKTSASKPPPLPYST